VLDGLRLFQGESAAVDGLQVRMGRSVIFIGNTFILIEHLLAFYLPEIKNSLRIRFAAHVSDDAADLIPRTDCFKVGLQGTLSFVSLGNYFFYVSCLPLINVIARPN
jgi:hypothetical protein